MLPIYLEETCHETHQHPELVINSPAARNDTQGSPCALGVAFFLSHPGFDLGIRERTGYSEMVDNKEGPASR